MRTNVAMRTIVVLSIGERKAKKARRARKTRKARKAK
jgi:hypothetical protein